MMQPDCAPLEEVVVVGKGSSHLHPTFSIVIFVTHQEHKSYCSSYLRFYIYVQTHDISKMVSIMHQTHTQP
jgi:hypothetical protein